MKKAYPTSFWDLKSQPRRSLLISDQLDNYLYAISYTAIQTHRVDNLSEELVELHYP